MRETFTVNAELRTDQGKGASRRLRRAKKVPAILYGGKDPAQALALDHNEMKHHLDTEAFYSHILTLKFDGKEQQAVLKDVQRHPSQPLLLHFDFQRVYADQLIHMHVPLHFVGGEKAPGVKTGGGLVEHYMIQVEVECLPANLPEFIEVDLSALDVNDSVHLSQLKLPTGVALIELKHKNDMPVAAVHVPKAVVEEVPAAEVPAGEVPATAVKAEGEPGAEGAKPGEPAKAGAAPAAGKDAKPGAAKPAAGKPEAKPAGGKPEGKADEKKK